MPDKKGWVITTSEDRPIAEIADELSLAGFSVGEVLGEIGSITGSADPGAVGNLRKIRGVLDISPDTGIDIGPPDAPIS